MLRARVGGTMSLYLSTVVLDVADMTRAAKFWTDALGYVATFQDASWTSLRHPHDKSRVRIGLQPADGAKTGVNPVHLDLATDDMEREAKRLEGLGATRVKGWPYPDDEQVNWIVMRDPDGHEFCVVQHPPERLVHRD